LFVLFGVVFALALTSWLIMHPMSSARLMSTGPSTPSPLFGLPTTLEVPAGPQAGPTLRLLSITAEEMPEEGATKRLMLHIPIKARRGVQIDVQDCVIQVFFYDMMDGQKVVETAADVTAHWVTPPADWIKSDTEELAVEYRLAKPHDGHGAQEDRKYFGYLVRLYYKQDLQGAVAQPEQLGQEHPAPKSLSKEATAAAAGQAAPAPEETVDTSTALPGIQAGSVLGLLPITGENKADAGSLQHFLLRIPIKARPDAHISMRDVVVQVLFYDLLDGQRVVTTAANVKSNWSSPPPNWKQSDTEELDVEYQTPKLRVSDAPIEDRKFYGYIVRVYYRRKLQGMAAHPEDLTKKFPAPAQLSEEVDAGARAPELRR
jgi:hypothetical protein